MPIKINTSIFRDYDIRGIYPGEVNEPTYKVIGKALAEYFKVKEIAVGRDTRISSPSLFASLVDGIISMGVDVVDLGLISTEINYFSSGFHKFPVNVIVSASHNPPEYNGLKIVKEGVVPLHGSYGLPEIRELTVAQNFREVKKYGEIRTKNIFDEWIEHALSFIDLSRLKNLKVVVDAANGMGGISWAALVDRLPVTIIPLYFEPDGNFPNHLADPLDSKNLVDLQKKIKETGADLGFAIDGDADRLFVVDDKSELLNGSLTTAMLAEHLLKKKGAAPVLYSVTCSRIVPEVISKNGGTPVRTRVGHSFIKTEMKNRGGLFAGEHSGHFYFRDNFTADSSTIAGLLFLEFASGKDRKLSDLRRDYEKYTSSGELNYYIDDAGKIIHNLKEEFRGVLPDTLDGVTFNFADWWFNVRLSKTEPLLRLNVEAANMPGLKEHLKKIEKVILAGGGRKKD